MKLNLSYWILFLLIPVFSCKTTQNTTTTQTVEVAPIIEEEIIEEVELEEVEVTLPLPGSIEDLQKKYPSKPYRGSADRHFDLLHTKLEVKFDWEKQYVFGVATLDLQPYFYDQTNLILDAKNFEINSITLKGKSPQAIEYTYDGQQINITLDKTYKRNEKLSLVIDYTAKPNEGELGGSAAISMDKGLYFINPLGKDPNKPQQIWTQGETESNSRWFPTIDKPNERCTQEIYVTVEDRFVTLSNGVMETSKKNSDGTRTDYWKMDIPHAPYLFMLAIGEYAVVKDTWKGIEVGYYVEPEYEEDAREIFAHTPEMMTYFSDITGIEYPWPKYSQAVVRDYVSGAMENTTASIFGEFVQKNKRQLIDNGNDGIVAHELFHHWFGDYVTCEGWSNLTINEGFATYSEYLWNEYKYGRDAAEFSRLNSQRSYIYSARNQGTRPIIDHYYTGREDMFDLHSYNKGALVLHMLRNQIGDKAFFEGMNVFLKSKALQSAEIDDLRLVYEEVTGLDLGLFFDQWFKSPGHPVLNISTRNSDVDSKIYLVVEQVQNPNENLAVYQFPLTVSIQVKTMTDPIVKTLWIDQRKQEFEFVTPSGFTSMRIDTSNALLAEINRTMTTEELVYQYENHKDFKERYNAINGLAGNYSPEAQAVLFSALDDPFWAIRNKALTEISVSGNLNLLEKIKQMAQNDEHSIVRARAITVLSDNEDESIKEIFYSKAIDSTESYTVINSAIEAIMKFDQNGAESIVGDMVDENDEGLKMTIASVYAKSKNRKNLDFFKENLLTISPYSSFSFYNNYEKILLNMGNYFDRLEASQVLKDMILDTEQNTYRRMAGMRLFASIHNKAKTDNDSESATTLDKEHFSKIDKVADYLVKTLEDGSAKNMAKSLLGK